jgi:DNA processing protein
MVQLDTLLLLSLIPGIGTGRLRSLVNHFPDPAEIRHATPRELCSVEGIESRTARSIVSFFRTGQVRDAVKIVSHQLRRMEQCHVSHTSLWNDNYPELLKKIYDPPPFFFYRGSMSGADRCSVALVGTRTPTTYGTRMAGQLARELASRGIPTVSGLARGIDTIAHEQTLEADGRTIAIIGSGLDVPYPPENDTLLERICDNGAVVSEFLMGTKPDAGNFPRRNRLISAWSLGTVVIETGIQGGAMITAASALEQNREVFAVPSAVRDGKPSGAHLLIREGKALLVEHAGHVLDELRPLLKDLLPTEDRAESRQLTFFEQQLYNVITDDPLHIDFIANAAALPVSEVAVLMFSLECKGIVRQLRGKRFVRV